MTAAFTSGRDLLCPASIDSIAALLGSDARADRPPMPQILLDRRSAMRPRREAPADAIAAFLVETYRERGPT